MSLIVLRADITTLSVDAIVNSADPLPIVGLGLDEAIHKAAGEELIHARRRIGELTTSEVAITQGYRLKAPYVIHTVGPVWEEKEELQRLQLMACYENALHLAKRFNLSSIAFPLISSGYYGCPKNIAYDCAVQAIKNFLYHHEMIVYLVLKDSLFEIEPSFYQTLKERLSLGVKPRVRPNQEDALFAIPHDLNVNQKRDSGIHESWLMALSQGVIHPTKKEVLILSVVMGLDDATFVQWLNHYGYNLDYDVDYLVMECLNMGIHTLTRVDLLLLQWSLEPLYKGALKSQRQDKINVV